MDQRQAMSTMLLSAFSRSKELKGRILFLLGALIVYRIGSHIPLPGVNALALDVYQQTLSSGLYGMFNTFTGGGLSRMSMFVLSVFPYISASIVMMILKIAVPYLSEIAKEGSKGQAKIEQYTKYLAVVLAFVQGFGLAKSIQAQQVNVDGSVIDLVADKSLMFPLHIALTIAASTLFLKWLSDRITVKGLYNGLSILIFAGIIAELPASIAQTIEMSQVGTITGFALLGLVAWVILMLAFVCFVESSERRLTLKNPRALSQAKQGNIDFSNEAYIPFKVNTPGVMPVIFASSVLIFMVGGFSLFPDSEIAVMLSTAFARGTIGYVALYALTIAVFSFLFASVMFDTKEQSEGLRKNGTFIPGIRPGKPTAMYFDYLLTRLTTIGAGYLVLVCVLPEIIGFQSTLALSFSGTSVLIIVGVIMGLFDDVKRHVKEQVQTELMNRHSLKKGPRRKVQR
jgi:preprotein translocase subunit SecY